MEITKEQKRLARGLKAQLPFRGQGIIAERTGKSRETVNKVLNGHWWNQDVVDAAVELIREGRESMAGIAKELMS